MIYALGIIVMLCFLATIAQIAFVWTMKQGIALENAARGRDADALKGQVSAMAANFAALDKQIRAIEQRPDAPAMEQYQKVLLELEDFGHTVRTLTHRMDETLESVRRTQNKIAARAKRPQAAPDMSAEIEEMVSQGSAAETPPSMGGRRSFGQTRG